MINIFLPDSKGSGIKPGTVHMDYTKRELGVQEQKDGAILVEGNWYCASMPQKLVEATQVYRKVVDPLFSKRDPEAMEAKATAKREWKQAMYARETYLFRPKENVDERGRIPLMCPAAGPAPTVSCGLKPNPRAAGRPLLPITGLPKAPGKVCTNKTSTSFHINDGGRHAQYYQFGSDEWERTYTHMRNQVESINNFAKEDSTFAIARPARRRMRGYTAQSFLIAITIVAVNLELIRTFLLERDERAAEAIDGVTSPRSKSNRSRRSSPETRIGARERNRRARTGTSPKKDRRRDAIMQT